ncbi:MAG: polysaccharide biosynthesis C-terminal domain-containing protein [Ignavibacteria bacterium]|nr:polysaccharide biosynthesis C-terminal domain-containing protein [Ignavibacteria bacterium]
MLLQREISVNKKDFAAFFSSTLIINFIIFPFYVIIVFAYCKIFFSEINSVLIMAVCLLVYLFSLGNILSRAMSALYLFKQQLMSLLLSRSFILVLILLALIFPGLSINQMLLFLLPIALTQLFLLFNYCVKNNLTLKLSDFDFRKAVSMLRISIPLGLAVMFSFLYDKIDIVIISRLTDFNEAAFYNIGYGIFKASAIAYSFIFVSGFTNISYLSRNKRAVRLFFKKYFTLLFLICLVLMIILFAGADIFVNLIYTSKYSDAADVVKILSLATFGLAFNNLTGIILNGLRLFKENMIVTLIGLIINVILNIIFIQKYGIAAAAVVTVITEYFIFAGQYLFIRKNLKM